jgi:hypothetical protein
MVYYRNYVPEPNMDKLVPDGTSTLIDFGDTPKYIYDNASLLEKRECDRAWFSGMHLELTINPFKIASIVSMLESAYGYPI